MATFILLFSVFRFFNLAVQFFNIIIFALVGPDDNIPVFTYFFNDLLQ